MWSESELMEEEIPEDFILEEILWRLPVKPLARFRSVCKTFNSAISSDPKFAVRQLKYSLAVTTFCDRKRLLLRDCWGCSSAFFLEKKNNEFAIQNINTSPIEHNKGSSSSHYSIVASCDGLVCVVNETYNELGLGSTSISFWNSLTGETMRVADPPNKIPPLVEKCSYGLGYDSSSDDYKLVWITFGFHNPVTGVSKPNEVAIFSLRTNTWRQIQHFPATRLTTLEPGVFFNGALYWTGFCKDLPSHNKKVVSFCLEKEKYTLLDLPAAIDFPGRIFFIGINVLGNKLAVSYPTGDAGSYELLFVNPCVNSDSWTKHTITIPPFSDGFSPVCLLDDLEEVLFQGIGGPLGVYHLVDGTFRYLHIRGLPKLFMAMTFSESLISPNTYKGKKFDIESI